MTDTRKLQSKDAPLFASQSPPVAGFARGTLYLVILAIIGVLIEVFSSTTPEAVAIYAPIVVVILRTLEGIIDKHSVEA